MCLPRSRGSSFQLTKTLMLITYRIISTLSMLLALITTVEVSIRAITYSININKITTIIIQWETLLLLLHPLPTTSRLFMINSSISNRWSMRWWTSLKIKKAATPIYRRNLWIGFRDLQLRIKWERAVALDLGRSDLENSLCRHQDLVKKTWLPMLTNSKFLNCLMSFRKEYSGKH